MSAKWPILCWLERKTLTQSINANCICLCCLRPLLCNLLRWLDEPFVSNTWVDIVLQIEDLVVVNLNEGVVKFPQSLDIAFLPREPVAVFKEAVNNLMSQLDVWQLETYAFQFE